MLPQGSRFVRIQRDGFLLGMKPLGGNRQGDFARQEPFHEEFAALAVGDSSSASLIWTTA
jgi:hypothetical protein